MFIYLQLKKACDMYTVALHDRIVGGVPAEIDEFPWLVMRFAHIPIGRILFNK